MVKGRNIVGRGVRGVPIGYRDAAGPVITWPATADFSSAGALNNPLTGQLCDTGQPWLLKKIETGIVGCNTVSLVSNGTSGGGGPQGSARAVMPQFNYDGTSGAPDSGNFIDLSERLVALREMYAQAYIDPQSAGSYARLVINYKDKDNYLAAQLSPAAGFYVIQILAGVASVSHLASAVAAGVYRISRAADVVTLYQGGVSILTLASSGDFAGAGFDFAGITGWNVDFSIDNFEADKL